MRSKTVQRILDETPKDVAIFVDKYAGLLVLINQVLKEKGITQKALAHKFDKQPSEINKWLSGEHNFTLRSLAKLEAELGETLLIIPKRDIKEDVTKAPSKWGDPKNNPENKPKRKTNKTHLA